MKNCVIGHRPTIVLCCADLNVDSLPRYFEGDPRDCPSYDETSENINRVMYAS